MPIGTKGPGGIAGAVDIRLRRRQVRHIRYARSGESVSINPFDDDNGSFFVLVNDEEQHSLWPAFADVPAGWRGGYGGADRTSCLAFIDRNWADIRPKSLRDRPATGRGFDE